MTVEAQITINNSKKEVWTTITDILHATKIINGIEKIEILNEPSNGLVGLKWRETRMYVVTNFTYNEQDDNYTCPQGNTLTTTGTWHKKSRDKNISYQFKKYRTPLCKTCPVRHLCTGRTNGGREIERSEFATAVEANNTRYKENATLYRKRQEINEHIFGTIKRKMGILLHKLKRTRESQW